MIVSLLYLRRGQVLVDWAVTCQPQKGRCKLLLFICRLAGVQEYPASEVTRRTPWVQTPVTQPQNALQQMHK